MQWISSEHQDRRRFQLCLPLLNVDEISHSKQCVAIVKTEVNTTHSLFLSFLSQSDSLGSVCNTSLNRDKEKVFKIIILNRWQWAWWGLNQ